MGNSPTKDVTSDSGREEVEDSNSAVSSAQQELSYEEESDLDIFGSVTRKPPPPPQDKSASQQSSQQYSVIKPRAAVSQVASSSYSKSVSSRGVVSANYTDFTVSSEMPLVKVNGLLNSLQGARPAGNTSPKGGGHFRRSNRSRSAERSSASQTRRTRARSEDKAGKRKATKPSSSRQAKQPVQARGRPRARETNKVAKASNNVNVSGSRAEAKGVSSSNRSRSRAKDVSTNRRGRSEVRETPSTKNRSRSREVSTNRRVRSEVRETASTNNRSRSRAKDVSTNRRGRSEVRETSSTNNRSRSRVKQPPSPNKSLSEKRETPITNRRSRSETRETPSKLKAIEIKSKRSLAEDKKSPNAKRMRSKSVDVGKRRSSRHQDKVEYTELDTSPALKRKRSKSVDLSKGTKTLDKIKSSPVSRKRQVKPFQAAKFKTNHVMIKTDPSSKRTNSSEVAFMIMEAALDRQSPAPKKHNFSRSELAMMAGQSSPGCSRSLPSKPKGAEGSIGVRYRDLFEELRLKPKMAAVAAEPVAARKRGRPPKISKVVQVSKKSGPLNGRKRQPQQQQQHRVVDVSERASKRLCVQPCVQQCSIPLDREVVTRYLAWQNRMIRDGLLVELPHRAGDRAALAALEIRIAIRNKEIRREKKAAREAAATQAGIGPILSPRALHQRLTREDVSKGDSGHKESSTARQLQWN